MKLNLLKSVLLVALVLTATLVLALKPTPVEAAGRTREWALYEVLYDGKWHLLGTEFATRHQAADYCGADYSGDWGAGNVKHAVDVDTGRDICH